MIFGGTVLSSECALCNEYRPYYWPLCYKPASSRWGCVYPGSSGREGVNTVCVCVCVCAHMHWLELSTKWVSCNLWLLFSPLLIGHIYTITSHNCSCISVSKISRLYLSNTLSPHMLAEREMGQQSSEASCFVKVSHFYLNNLHFSQHVIHVESKPATTTCEACEERIRQNHGPNFTISISVWVTTDYGVTVTLFSSNRSYLVW